MLTADEKECFHSFPLMAKCLVEEQKRITGTSGFHGNCLNPNVLEALAYKFVGDKGRLGDD